MLPYSELDRAHIYRDRQEAGRAVARLLHHYAGRADVIVLGLARGGVPVAAEVATALHAPLDVLVVRKLGVPQYPEIALGALASGGTMVLNEEIIRHVGLTTSDVEAVRRVGQAELDRRERTYRGDRSPLDLKGRIVILVDDGLATGATMRAAIQSVRAHHPQRIVVAVPVGSRETSRSIASEVDELVCVHQPQPFYAVGVWYAVFDQTSDAEVRALLRRADLASAGRSITVN